MPTPVEKRGAMEGRRENFWIEREKSRAVEFMDQIGQRQKTLGFCATQEHAARLQNYINQIKDNPGSR